MMQLVKGSRFVPLASIDAYCMIEQNLPSGLAYMYVYTHTDISAVQVRLEGMGPTCK